MQLLTALRSGSPHGSAATESLALPAGEVHVWQARLDAEETPLPVRLAPDESERAARQPSRRLRARFLQSRALLRVVLGSYLGIAPEALAFAYGAEGKPQLIEAAHKAGASPVQFNLSHTGFCWVLAVASEGPVGLDVEDTSRRVDVEGVGSRVFSAHEMAMLARLSGKEKTEAFFRCWTAREAITKARGEGVFTLGEDLDIELDPARPPRVRRRGTADPGDIGWVLTPVPVPVGLVCMLATAGTPAALRSYLVPL